MGSCRIAAAAAAGGRRGPPTSLRPATGAAVQPIRPGMGFPLKIGTFMPRSTTIDQFVSATTKLLPVYAAFFVVCALLFGALVALGSTPAGKRSAAHRQTKPDRPKAS
jgi:hypothetical protein